MRDCAARDQELFRISQGEWALMLVSRVHAVTCPACRARVAEFRNVSRLLHDSMAGDPPAGPPMRRIPVPVASAIIIAGLLATGSVAWEAHASPVFTSDPPPVTTGVDSCESIIAQPPNHEAKVKKEIAEKGNPPHLIFDRAVRPASELALKPPSR